MRTLKPATIYSSNKGYIKEVSSWFEWYYKPHEKPFDQWVDEFANLFETIIDEQTGQKNIVLPLSGGLDSRTQAVALKRLGKKVTSFSYAFQEGHNEIKYGKKIAEQCGFDFHPLTVQEGYLWNCIEELANINQCSTEFTHPRQMAFIKRYPQMGDLFSLGHWGDVLFDNMGLPDDLSFDEQVDILLKKIVKKGGWELAEQLWKYWDLGGKFQDYLYSRMRELLSKIQIKNANARLRAFKSLYWAPRWTSINLSVFEKALPISLPYYDDRMCQFICSVPEKYLANRQIQIAYIKKYAPELARIPWQEHKPFNLYNYFMDKIPWNIPFRVVNKAKRSIQYLTNDKIIQRNWEIQFQGEDNDQQLYNWLLKNPAFKELVPEKIIFDYYIKFKYTNPIWYSHPVSMLLTLSAWSKWFWK